MNITPQTLEIILPGGKLVHSPGLSLGQMDQVEHAVGNWMTGLHWAVRIDRYRLKDKLEKSLLHFY